MEHFELDTFNKKRMALEIYLLLPIVPFILTLFTGEPDIFLGAFLIFPALYSGPTLILGTLYETLHGWAWILPGIVGLFSAVWFFVQVYRIDNMPRLKKIRLLVISWHVLAIISAGVIVYDAFQYFIPGY